MVYFLLGKISFISGGLYIQAVTWAWSSWLIFSLAFVLNSLKGVSGDTEKFCCGLQL